MRKYLVVCPEKRDPETKKVILPQIEYCVDAEGHCEAFAIASARYPKYKNIKIYEWKYPTQII